MKKIFKLLFLVLIFAAICFGFYLYKLHALAIEGNNVFALRCTKVNPLLISYKNSFLKFADYLKNPNQHTKEEVRGFFDNYISGMRAYIPEETKWLEMQQKYMNRLDFRLIEPWYIKQAGEYQWKMYEAYRDDAQYMLDLADQKLTSEQLNTNYPDSRQRRDKYNQLYFESFEKALKINDWRKIFGNVPLPEGCNKENLTIPNTSGSIDWEGKPPTPSPIPVNLEDGPAS